MKFLHRAIVFIGMLLGALPGWALDARLANQLANEDNDVKINAIKRIAEIGDQSALALLQAFADGELYLSAEGKPIIIRGEVATDAATGIKLAAIPENHDAISANNRVRRELASALAASKLFSPYEKLRLAAVKELQANPEPEMLPMLERAIGKESNSTVKRILGLALAQIKMHSPDPTQRVQAIQVLAHSTDQDSRRLLATMAGKKSDGSFAEADEKVRVEARIALRAMENRLRRIEWLGHAFSGLSLGSILLLAALGLAITFGLMGIINMAHGEMLMIGAYATFVIQTMFRRYFPDSIDWYILAAVPFSFLVAGVVGIALERSVIRFLYGRPLETLLCTWGISLILIQSVRGIFGAQNVEVANPTWMSGGIALESGLTLPYNRIAIIAFAAIVVGLTWLLLNKTRLGLFVRGVTQNRTMADCVGVPTGRIDMWTFGLGSGIAGLGGCALSQIGNVGPELGQSYIVDSFMVVVLGGVGNILGTILAAIGLGEVNKFLEPHAGAVLGKIFVLIFIIFFIQKRPQGLFAVKGRSAEAMA